MACTNVTMLFLSYGPSRAAEKSRSVLPSAPDARGSSACSRLRVSLLRPPLVWLALIWPPGFLFFSSQPSIRLRPRSQPSYGRTGRFLAILPLSYSLPLRLLPSCTYAL